MDFLNTTLREVSQSLFHKDFDRWRAVFQNLIVWHDPNLRIFITKPYERPLFAGNEFFPDILTDVKTVDQMSASECAEFDMERRTFETILECLPNDVTSCYKTQETSFSLWNSLMESYGSNTKRGVTSSDKGMKKENTTKTSKNKVDSEPSSCVSCIKLTSQINRYKEDSEHLLSENEKLREANSLLKENEKMYENKHKAFVEEHGELQAKIYDQQDEISSYVNMLTKVKKNLADTEAEVLNLKEKLSKVASSNLVFNGMLDSQRTDKRNKAGFGYTYVPPPFDYCPLPSKDPIKDYVPTFVKAGITPVKPAVSIKISTPDHLKAEKCKPVVKQSDTSTPEQVRAFTSEPEKNECVKAKNEPPVSVEEVVEVEDLPEEAKIQVEKVDVKPENHILTNETVKVSNKKGKNKVENESKKVQNQMKDSNVKSKNEQPLRSTCSTSEASTSTCTHKCSCSVNASSPKPSTVHSPPQPFVGKHWNRSYVERRSCFRCGQQGHIIRDCKLLSLDRFGRGMPRTSSFRNSYLKSFSRRSSYSPVSSCASNSPKPMARVNKVVPSRPQVQQHNIVENKSSEPNRVWKQKSTNNTSMKSAEFLKYHKLMDVMIMDDSGQPKSIKAWVSHKI